MLMSIIFILVLLLPLVLLHTTTTTTTIIYGYDYDDYDDDGYHTNYCCYCNYPSRTTKLSGAPLEDTGSAAGTGPVF